MDRVPVKKYAEKDVMSIITFLDKTEGDKKNLI
jgi:hypothetical protein